MADIDPDEFDERVAALDDELSQLLAEMEATCITWARELFHVNPRLRGDS
jgi:hypothetical protein